MLGLLNSNSASQQFLTKPVTLLILKNPSEDSQGFSSFSRIFRWSNPLVFQHQNPPHWRGCFLYPTPTHVPLSPEGLQLAKYVSEIRASPGMWGGRVCVGARVSVGALSDQNIENTMSLGTARCAWLVKTVVLLRVQRWSGLEARSQACTRRPLEEC